MITLARSPRLHQVLAWLVALAGPWVLTAVLTMMGGTLGNRDYVFLYLALVAALAILGGLGPALLTAAVSFLLLDYFFTDPVGQLSILRARDLVNLLVFAATAVTVGMLASRRRRALLEAKELAVQLREANSELVRLNREQAEAAQAAVRLARSQERVKTLQEADRLRRELLANVSHELRTPLGTILTESTGPLVDGGQAPAARLGVIADAARRLELLVSDMLDMARIESGTLELDLEPIRLDDAIAAAAERLRVGSSQREVEWDREAAGAEVLADWNRFGQIIDNLLANADRFGPAGTPIRIGVEPDQAGLVTVLVADQGPGVPEPLRDHVFDRFVHANPASQQVGSPPGTTGLGLAIVKGLVEAHAGSVALDERSPGTGATFRFTLPAAEED